MSILIVRMLPYKSSKHLVAALVLADIHGNMLLIKSYSYTTLTSVMAFNFLGAPLTMVFSRLFFKAKYCAYHIVGVVLGFAGLTCIVISEISQTNDSHNTLANMIIGDIMAILSITLLSAYDLIKLIGATCCRRRYFYREIRRQVFWECADSSECP
eukprot:TRINITY_DN1144_c0_g3_i1.p1 TRINITY_DN1144_c0_g3~~TRINITY_DN1144_c0_g3_i1.p1  ORF type:complete len:156 (+),score=7.14 TRINITY_DN1144_c0_g3_i1:220-687(+)